MTSKERIMTVLRGGMPDRVPVSLYKINPFDTKSFWSQHKSFDGLLETARELQDTLDLYRPSTGFFFSAPGSIEVKAEEFDDTPLSKTVNLSVATRRGLLTRSSRTSKTSIHHWVQKPWIENERDIQKFLDLPYTPFKPDLTDYFRRSEALGDKGIVVIALPDPLAVIAELFAPGDMPHFIVSSPRLVHALLDRMQERLVFLYRFVSTAVFDTVIRIRGPEYATPPELPQEYFPDVKKAFADLALRYDRELIEILRRGNSNYICYHLHGGYLAQVFPYIAKLGVDIFEPAVNSVESPGEVLKIRRMAGDKMVLMGGPLAEDMEFRQPQDIQRMVKDAITQGGRSGRFMLIPSNIPESSPLSAQTSDNYIRFLHTGVECGTYPLA